jgi:L-threonylcarbamoyladenylate synthase
MPIRPHITNVTLTRTFHSLTRALQALAQRTVAEPHPPRSTLKARPSHYQPLPHLPLTMETNILPVDPSKLGKITFQHSTHALVDEWDIQYEDGDDLKSLERAAQELTQTDVPVAFPTETVYGLGADATRSAAVRAIFAAKGRPADNPLIVHVHSIAQLRQLLAGKEDNKQSTDGRPTATSQKDDIIPNIYKPLIRKFWPGPLTLILPNPDNSVLAPEVTAGLSTFGARMPRSILALSLIRLAGVPLAAPSANASTRPSPTAAEHVHDDLASRIHTIIDGGPCEVGVESTVVDGLSDPPSILRPGGVTVEQLRTCEGWEGVVVGYKDRHEQGGKPRAPGMKYRHYSPKAPVVLHEHSGEEFDGGEIRDEVRAKGYKTVGIIRTTKWPVALGMDVQTVNASAAQTNGTSTDHSTATLSQLQNATTTPSQANLLRSLIQHQIPHAQHLTSESIHIWDMDLGRDKTEGVARGLFSALRELDKKGVEVIYVEGIDDTAGDDIAAAVMNRLRKAAEVRV